MTDPRGGDPPTVLLVEDSPAIQAVVREVLEGEGFAVIARADLRSAHEALEAAGPPALAVIDYQLPDGVGTDLCKGLRAGGVPCLVISAYSRSLEPAMDVRADAWIGKPFEIDDLIRAVRELVTPSGAIISKLGPPGELPKVLRIDPS